MQPSRQPTVLIADTDARLRAAIAGVLARTRIDVVEVAAPRDAGVSFGTVDVAVVAADGPDAVTRLRRQGDTPLIVVAPEPDDGDAIQMLEAGADDYLPRDVSPREVAARVRAMLRRRGHPTSEESRLRFGDIEIDPVARRLYCDGREVELTRRQFDLLLRLATQPGRVFTRAELLESVWPHASGSSEQTVTEHVRALRHKLGEDPRHPRYLRTVHGVGYRWERRHPVR